MNKYLIPWTTLYSSLTFSDFLKNTTSDYPIIYNYFLFVVSKIVPKEGYIYSIKTLSMIFDISSSFAIYFICRTKLDKLKSSIFFSITLMLPTVILNSGQWGQCDSIYVSFMLWTLYFLIINKPILSLSMFSFALVNKLQAIFMLPFLFLCFLKKRYKIWHFFVIPIIYFLIIMPALIAGHPIKHLILPYTSFVGINIYCPNLYSLFLLNRIINNNEILIYFLIAFAFILCCLYVIYFYRKNIKLTARNSIILVTISIFICVFTLPKMHDRYFYAIDLLSVLICAFILNKYTIISAIGVSLGSLFAYFAYYINYYSAGKNSAYEFVIMGSIFMLIALMFGVINIKNNTCFEMEMEINK